MHKVKGRPTKFDDEIQKKMEKLYLRGFCDVEVCDIVGITEATLTGWKKRYPDFFTSLKGWKATADAKVEKSLYERACGYQHPEEKIFCNNGEIVRCETTKQYPPDYQSMALWLKNRQPDRWRDKVDVTHDGAVNINIVRFAGDDGDDG